MKLLSFENSLLNRFDYFCKKSLKFSNYKILKTEKRMQDKIVLYSKLSEDIFYQLYTLDDYNILKFVINIRDFEIAIENEMLYKALMLLSEKKREIILLSFFMDMTDEEIGKYMLIPRSSVQYNRKSALKYIKNLMKRGKWYG